MVEIEPITTVAPVKSEDRRVVLDLFIAGLICLAAACYWFWDTKANPEPPPAPIAKAPVTVPQSQPVAKDPFNDEGFRLYSAADYAGAEAQFRKAIGADPKRAIGYCNLGAALIALRRYDEAVSTLKTAMTLDPSLNLARDNLNWALQEKAKNGK